MKAELNFQGEKFYRQRGRVMKDVQDRKKKRTERRIIKFLLTFLWKILKEMRILDHLTCLLRNLYAGQEATVQTGHGTTDWFQIGKGVCQSCILYHCIFNLYEKNIINLISVLTIW